MSVVRLTVHRALAVALLLGAVAAGTALLLPSAPARAADNPWLARRVLGIAHAGGENEHPHSTMFGYGESWKDGVPMLDFDLQLTGDGVPIVLHNTTVDRTTNGTGDVNDMTFAQVHALDAAYWFTPDCWACTGQPVDDYVYRGIRTGDKAPPAGYTADDFAIPSLREAFQRFPGAYMDIEIKDDGDNVDELALKLAALIHEFHREDRTVVASFGQSGMDTFRAAAPTVATSATLNEMTEFFLHNTIPAHVQIVDVPPTYTVGGTTITIVTPEFVKRAHDAGLAVWVWPNSRSRETAEYYGELVDMGVDGINAAAPHVLMQVLRDRGVAWTPPPDGQPESPTTLPPTGPTSTTSPGAPAPTPDAPAASAVSATPSYTG